MLGEALAQVPAAHRRRLLVRADSAAATHAVIDWLVAHNSARRTVEYSIGWAIGEPDRTAIAALPAKAWAAALAADGNVREQCLIHTGCPRGQVWRTKNRLQPADPQKQELIYHLVPQSVTSVITVPPSSPLLGQRCSDLVIAAWSWWAASRVVMRWRPVARS